ncbi:kinesin-like protein KIN-14M isoform X3 [Apium graveolens]|uniref:kinesin-like protein KIN-14M isoform X3 n=1 Tax=Apium graveolens TaxID=4045 RepID=UPI003D7AA1B7
MDSVTLLHAEKIIYLEYWKSKNGKRVACLLRKVIQEIERRISTQAEYIRTQNNLFRAREERYQSRIRVLEALASGTNEEAHVLQKLLEANPGLNIDMAQICGTISGDTGGADGTPLISGRSTWTICYLSSTLFSKTCMLLHYLAHLVLSKSTCIS